MTPLEARSWAEAVLAPEPDPIVDPSLPSVADRLLAQPLRPRVRALVEVRRDQARAWYPDELRVGNGRDPWRDLVQELVDALMYAEQTGDAAIAYGAEALLEHVITRATMRGELGRRS